MEKLKVEEWKEVKKMGKKQTELDRQLSQIMEQADAYKAGVEKHLFEKFVNSCLMIIQNDGISKGLEMARGIYTKGWNEREKGGEEER